MIMVFLPAFWCMEIYWQLSNGQLSWCFSGNLTRMFPIPMLLVSITEMQQETPAYYYGQDTFLPW